MYPLPSYFSRPQTAEDIHCPSYNVPVSIGGMGPTLQIHNILRKLQYGRLEPVEKASRFF